MFAGEDAEMEILFDEFGDTPEDALAAAEHRGETLVALLHAPPAHVKGTGDKDGGMQIGLADHFAQQGQEQINVQAMHARHGQNGQHKTIQQNDARRRRRRQVGALMLARHAREDLGRRGQIAGLFAEELRELGHRRADVAGPSANARAAQAALGAESLNETSQRRFARSIHPFHSDDDLHDGLVPPISPR
jgi:hypothetical protein